MDKWSYSPTYRGYDLLHVQLVAAHLVDCIPFNFGSFPNSIWGKGNDKKYKLYFEITTQQWHSDYLDVPGS